MLSVFPPCLQLTNGVLCVSATLLKKKLEKKKHLNGTIWGRKTTTWQKWMNVRKAGRCQAVERCHCGATRSPNVEKNQKSVQHFNAQPRLEQGFGIPERMNILSEPTCRGRCNVLVRSEIWLSDRIMKLPADSLDPEWLLMFGMTQSVKRIMQF